MKIGIKKNILKDIFYFLTATIFLFIAAELIWPNSVLSFIDINRVIIMWFFSWILLF